ncbi:DUF2125 domain-containing protein [Paracoccus xiamenensis]|uniref:DUF2125 domain-containing protein n=1 Tax=Paracoccus xiamenensis TaxID=2714901 RepID=UPI00140C61B6|nr:DUF2125 domain-containing protein [Paracoccus xiamenensis]NHF72917.1 DUF2125 domain-containing protein [Paracoccus xiamenensis]
MKRLTSATAIGMILAATPALAEVTPKSVWENLNAYYDRYGLTVETASVDEAGDTLTVNDLVLHQQAEGAETRVDMGDVVFTATGDGAVRMDMADELTVTVELPETDPAEEAAMEAPADAADSAAEAAGQAADAADAATEGDAAAADEAMADAADAAADAEAAMAAHDSAEPRKITLNAQIADEDITIREDGDAMVYDYLLPKLDVTVAQIELDDGKIIENPATIAFANLKGSDRIEGTDAQKIVQSATTDSITFNLDITGDDGESGKGQFVLNGVGINSDTGTPAGYSVGSDNLTEMLKAGMTVKGDLKIASVTGNLDMVTKDEEGQTRPVTMKFDGAESAVTFAMDQSRISYAGTGGATNAEMTIPDLPVPVGYGVGSASFNVDFPIAMAEQAQDFAVTYKLDDVTLTDGVWGLFDPQGALPRDPASLDLDLAGSVKVLRDFFDTASLDTAEKLEDPNLSEEERNALMEEMMAPPADLRDLTINKVALDLMGAKAEVTGKLAAPEQGDMETPVGTISGRFEGVNALLDKLGAAGLVPAEQMMGVKMMLQMFSKPDAQNPEVLTTELEFNEQGQIFANGQQVK